MMIEKRIGSKFIRINPDAADLNINRVINLVYTHRKTN